MRQSMTGFAGATGGLDGLRWSWDVRSVNGKGLDLRIRVPDWIEGLESAIRAATGPVIARGNVTVSLRVQGAGEESAPRLSSDHLAVVLAAMTRIEAEATTLGLSLAPSTAAQIVGLRGMLDGAAAQTGTTALCAQLLSEFDAVVSAFVAMRVAEGRALQAVLAGQIDEIETLTLKAGNAWHAQRDAQAEKLRGALGRVMDNADGADPQRVAQELALIAVKADVTEELDRLNAHVEAARALLAQTGPVGRKLDFLTQEFNREANTLCSKAQSVALTRVGLDLKAVIDQMREQVQNVE